MKKIFLKEIWNLITAFRTFSSTSRLLIFPLAFLVLYGMRLEAQSFSQSSLDLGAGGIGPATSLMFGPDGRLYVLQLNGTINIYTVQRDGINDYTSIASEVLLLVKNIPNHNDDGTSNGGNNREATGITLAGTAANPVMYVTSSDSRVGGPGGDLNLDTNSGVITRITWNGSAWIAVDIVRGLPRSEENHATNGLEFVVINGTDFLIVSEGGHTNAGSPSDNFAWTTEYALSAAMLSINLTMLEAMPILNDGVRDFIYDIPTLDDPTRENVSGSGSPASEDPDDAGYSSIDVGDPWGGNDGLNQAMLIIDGPVQIFSPGYRNTYDLVITQDGKVYNTDNGANGGWGGLPVNEGVDGTVTNGYISSEPGSTSAVGGEQVNNVDHLTLITTNIQTYEFGSFYGGHPAPIRANPAGAGLFTNPTANAINGNEVFRTLMYDPNGSRPGSTNNAAIALPANWPAVPLSLANPVEGDWRGPGISNPDGPNDVLTTVWGTNTNGIDEYTASNFAGAMQGDLIAGFSSEALRRVQLNPDGSLETLTNVFLSNLGGNPLGITCNSDSDPFPGTIWVATQSGAVKVFEPQDFVICILPGEAGYDPNGDNDSDGYTNQDEIDNMLPDQTVEEVICNGGNQPNDFDKEVSGIRVSDLNDPDDDADGIPDANDPFQIGDPLDNGSDAFSLPVLNELFSGNPALKGYLGLGFTGLMNNGAANPNWLLWLDRRDDPSDPNTNDILGGAVGAMTMQMTAGTALGAENTQEKGFQYGVNVDQTTGGFTVESRLISLSDALQLYHPASPANGELGIFMGDGSQANYIKMVISKTGITAVQEINNVAQTPLSTAIPSGNRPQDQVLLYFIVNPVTGIITLQYQFDEQPAVILGTITAEGSILNAIQNSGTSLAVGLTGSSNAAGEEVEGTWDYLFVQGSQPTIEQEIPDLSQLSGASPTSFNLDEYFSDDGGDSGLTYSIVTNSNPAISAIVEENFLNLQFPASPASSNITVRATDEVSLFIEQTFNVSVSDEAVPLIRIRANGATISATDAPNPDWIGITGANAQSGSFNGIDYAVNTGTLSTQNTANRHSSLPVYVPQAIFANERYDVTTAPEMAWTFELPNGPYVVRLYMGNGFAGTSSPGQRVFDISIEGAIVENDLDLVSTFGHQFGGMLEYPVNLTDNVLNILFSHVVENPLINGIEILGNGSTIHPPISVAPIASQSHQEGDLVNLTVNASGGDPNENFSFSASGLPNGLQIEPTTGLIFGTLASGSSGASPYNTSVTVSKPSDAPVILNFNWNVLDPAVSGGILYRVNAGGQLTASNDSAPISWSEDQASSGANGTAGNGTPSLYVNSGTEDATFGAALPGSFTNNTGYPNSLFATERYNTLAVPNNMQWNFPVSNGTYTVNLIFAEIWTGAQTAGIRVFDVMIEGQELLTDFDQTAAYGWATAGVESFDIIVTDGNLDIDFIQGVQNPSIKAIEIRSATPTVADQWTNITNVTEHIPRHENSFVQAGNKFYLFGGRESADVTEIYDYNSNTWTAAASTAPFEFNHFQAVQYQGLIWVIGAFKDNDSPENPADNIYVYNPATDVWIQGPAVPVLRKRGSAGLVVYNNKFYVIAGNTTGHAGGYIPWFDEFDPATGTWTPLTDAPRARDHFHAAVVGNKLYVLGGRLSGGPGGTFAPLIPQVDVYDFGTNSWSTLPAGSNLPTPRAASSTVTFQGKVVVIGGEGNGQAYTNTDALDVSTGSWTSLDPLNNPRHGTQGIVSGNGIWTTSGSPNQGGGNQNKMEVYGMDNPGGSTLVAGTLSIPGPLSIPAGSTEQLTISNSGGNQGIFVSDIAINGSGASNFTVVSATSFLIPSGGSSIVQIQHTGSSEGDVASLVFESGSGGVGSLNVTSGPESSDVLYRVNAGGPLVAATEAETPDWDTDQGSFGTAGNSPYLINSTSDGGVFDQSSASAYQGAINMSHPSLPPGTPASIFTTERFDAVEAPEMLWQFPVPVNTAVEIRLYFAELFNEIDAAGQRVFDVSLEGTVPVGFNDIDPFGTAGALGAFMVSHRATITDGTLDLQFIHGTENPALKAIEIVDVSETSSGIAPVVTNPGVQVSVDGDAVNLQILASDTNSDPCGPLTYEALNLPPNLSINPATGMISGTLTAGSGTGGSGAFIEDDGLVVMQAETDFADLSGGWNFTTVGGDNFLSATGDHFSVPDGQTVVKNIQISTPGVYRFHIKSDITGTVTTDENDTWFKIENTPDVHFFTVQGGALENTQQFLNELGNPASTTRILHYPAGNAQGRSNFGSENPGSQGYFKVYRSGAGGNKWSTFTIDNRSYPIYAYFPNPGTFALSMSERSAGHKIDKMALVHIDERFTGVNQALLNGYSESTQGAGNSPGASANSPYNITVSVTNACEPPLTTDVAFSWNVTATQAGIAPLVTNPGAQSGVDGESVSLQVIASDGNPDPCGPLTYEALDLPPSLSINPGTGLISGTLLSGTGGGTAGAFIEEDGLVLMEAETDFTESPGGWNSTIEGGVNFLSASSNHFSTPNGQTVLKSVQISTPGVYRFHIKSNITGTVTTDENDSWFKIDNTPDVHFFAVQGGALTGTQQFLNELGNPASTTKILHYPAGNAQGRSNFGSENPGSQGYFKVFRTGGGGNKWSTFTIDNNSFPIYAYFPNAGTFTLSMTERSAGHKVDKIALVHIDERFIDVNQTLLNGYSESTQAGGNTPGASSGSPYNITVNVTDACAPALTSQVSFTWNVTSSPVGNPSASIQITPGETLTASTFGNNSFIITNTGDDNIVNVTLNTITGHMMDVVFDPVGTAGDSVAKCLTNGNGNSPAQVGLTVTANGSGTANCATVFELPHNGLNNQEGYDALSLDFTDFNPAESFVFGVDMDPTSIKGDLTSGDAGSISGFELIGSTISVTFASGAIYTTSLYDEGSLGGSDAIISSASNALVSPTITVDGSAASRLVTVANQTVQINGQPNASVSLLRVDGRLFIDPGNPSVGFDVDAFEANEAMAKQLYTITLNGSGVGTIPVVLTQTSGASGTPNGGLNQFIAVTTGPGGINSLGSNVLVLEFDPNVVIAPSALVEITPGSALDASTFSGNSFQVTNTSTGNVQITGISFDLSTAIYPDMVFDPTGAGGDETASCFTPNSGTTAVGLVAPANPCTTPFSQPRNGGFDVLSIAFTNFDPLEQFDFTTDVDPNSIQGVPGAGNAGAVSGAELIGATITITFSDGSILLGSLYEDGSLGGGQVVIAANPPAAPAILISGIGAGPATVSDLNQTVTVTGTPGDAVSLLQMDSRLYIASGGDPFNVPDVTYYANEAMSGKTLYTGIIGAGGTLDIPVTLLVTTGASGTPDGGLNQFLAVTSAAAYSVDQQVSSISNPVTLLYDPDADATLTISYTLQGRTDHSTALTVDFFEEGSTIAVYEFTPSGSPTGEVNVTGVSPGTYLVAVKSGNYLQKVATLNVAAGGNSVSVGQLLAGDANNDNAVTLEDFSLLSDSFNLGLGETSYNPAADFNGDGAVTLEDFSLLASNFNVEGEAP